MATETAKRKQTLKVLDQMKASGMPPAASHRNEWSGEELPPEEAGAQADFDAQKGARTEQSMVNTLPDGTYKDVYNTVADVKAGPTGMSPLGAENPGMTPYSPEEFERRSSFSPTGAGDKLKTGVTALDQPLAKAKRTKKKPADETSDVPADVNAGP